MRVNASFSVPGTRIARAAFGLLLTGCFAGTAAAHEGHDHSATQLTAASEGPVAMSSTFQVGDKTYRWEHRNDLGAQPEKMVAAAKGGLHNNADQDPQTKEIVTVVKSYGLVTLDPEMKAWRLVEDQDPHFAAGMNSHGTDCFEFNGESLWAFASTNTGEVVITKRGEILAKLSKPEGTEFANEKINQYYANGGKFVPCDVVFAPEAQALIVVTGYAPGDYALTAKNVDGSWQWTGAAWGGKENEGGPFSTAHGVEVNTIGGNEVVEVASRSHGRIYGFTADGEMVAMPGAGDGKYIQLPPRSNPCNIANHGDELFLPLLNPLADSNGVAPVLIISDGKPVGRLVPAEYEGLNFMHHMHGFIAIEHDGQLFGIALSWPNGGENSKGKRNDGQIAIFEAVEVK
ncbi:NHL repeat-containing protein [Aporhodopirellula aestuarii]|uniref:Uncharacterized protein n=1 Tax=Aporhodopirellula aestuarii TaxID=2950107 RepID=A0ABT0TZ37_9BACT|nr:hypothetical protein [Aporhodopirellula aestuarii]MCM2369830.1 hypothetical protein [Aporhodopirellula aestuarii]